MGNIIAKLLLWLGPKGLEFGRYSIDYHFIRNWIYVNRHMGAQRAQRHTPQFAKRLIAMYNSKGEIDARWMILLLSRLVARHNAWKDLKTDSVRVHIQLQGGMNMMHINYDPELVWRTTLYPAFGCGPV